MARGKAQTLRSVSWWLGGDEECPHCHQLYAYEIEVRCPECDGPSCPHCVTRLERGVVCVACDVSPAEDEDASRG